MTDCNNLIIDRVYRGSRHGNAADDPLPQLVGVSGGGGFRYIGDRTALNKLHLITLKSNFNDPDWPDHLDHETGTKLRNGSPVLSRCLPFEMLVTRT